jgi:hypothetical protein
MNARFPITVIIGCVFFISGLCMLAKAYDFVTHATRTSGKVVAIDQGDADDVSTIHPVFVFTDATGVEHRCRSPYGSSWFFFAPGQRVPILYDPAVPTHAEIDSFESIWLFSFISMGMGVFFIASHYRWIRKMKLEKNNC